MKARQIASLALLLFTVLLALLATLHILRADADPVRHRLSEYAIGPYGYLMTVVFATATLAILALAVALWAAAARSRWIRLACLGLVGAGVSNALMAIFPAEVWVDGATAKTVVGSAGWIHDRLAISHALCWSGVVVATPLGFRTLPDWRRFAIWSTAAGVGVALAMATRTFAPMGIIGLTQRAWITAVFIWGLTHALAIRSMGRSA